MRLKITTTLMIVFCLALSGCAKLISHYDPATAQAIGTTAKSIDFFYGSLSLKQPSKRQYAHVAKEALQVDVSFNALSMHTNIQPNNQETRKMINNARTLWQKYKQKLQQSHRYSDTKIRLHRKRLHEMFQVMLKAELSKK